MFERLNEVASGEYSIPSDKKILFGNRPVFSIDDECLRNAFEFSYHQAINLNQKTKWYESSDDEQRSHLRMFCDTTEGKLGEEGFHKLCCKNGISVSDVDYSITSLESGDNGIDFIAKQGKVDKLISVRTSSSFSNLMLLETSKNWDKHDYLFLCRTEPCLHRIIKSLAGKEEVWKQIKSINHRIEVTGFIKQEDMTEVKGNVIKRGEKLLKTKILTTNYYVMAGDLREAKII